MATFIRKTSWSVLLGCFLTVSVWAQTPEPAQREEQVIEPELDRRDIVVPKIDTENFEITGFGGVLNIEDFGSNAVYGARLAYHITEDFFLEGTFGRSEVSDDSFRNFGLTLFQNQDEDLTYWNVSVGFNALPGEVFVWKNYALTSVLYLIAGAGNTNFDDEDFFTANFGAGLKVLPTDYLSVRLDVRDHVFSSDVLGNNETTHNIEVTGNIGFFF